MPSAMELIRVKEVLMNRTLIVGAGAFQHINALGDYSGLLRISEEDFFKDRFRETP